jgi:hypothetical protein
LFSLTGQSAHNQARELEHWFRNITGNSPSTFIENLFGMYEIRLLNDINDLSMVEDAITELDGLRTSVVQCGDGILQTEGHGTQYIYLDNIQKEVQAVIQMLEEVLCEGMAEPLGLLLAHRNRSLMYQRA